MNAAFSENTPVIESEGGFGIHRRFIETWHNPEGSFPVPIALCAQVAFDAYDQIVTGIRKSSEGAPRMEKPLPFSRGLTIVPQDVIESAVLYRLGVDPYVTPHTGEVYEAAEGVRRELRDRLAEVMREPFMTEKQPLIRQEWLNILGTDHGEDGAARLCLYLDPQMEPHDQTANRLRSEQELYFEAVNDVTGFTAWPRSFVIPIAEVSPEFMKASIAEPEPTVPISPDDTTEPLILWTDGDGGAVQAENLDDFMRLIHERHIDPDGDGKHAAVSSVILDGIIERIEAAEPERGWSVVELDRPEFHRYY